MLDIRVTPIQCSLEAALKKTCALKPPPYTIPHPHAMPSHTEQDQDPSRLIPCLPLHHHMPEKNRKEKITPQPKRLHALWKGIDALAPFYAHTRHAAACSCQRHWPPQAPSAVLAVHAKIHPGADPCPLPES
eukprot:1159656-Pelagomonas_calceolata.AAC.11